MKINEKKTLEYVTLAVSAVGGKKVSEAASTLIPEGMRSPLLNAGISVGSLVVATILKGNSLPMQIARGVLIGASINQADVVIDKLVGPIVPPLTTAMKKAFGVNGYNGLRAALSPSANMQQEAVMQTETQFAQI